MSPSMASHTEKAWVIMHDPEMATVAGGSPRTWFTPSTFSAGNGTAWVKFGLAGESRAWWQRRGFRAVKVTVTYDG